MSLVVADALIGEIVEAIIEKKAKIKRLLKEQEALENKLFLFMKEHDELVDADGVLVCTWKESAGVSYFDAKRFKGDNESLYNQYISLRAGSRRLVFK